MPGAIRIARTHPDGRKAAIVHWTGSPRGARYLGFHLDATVKEARELDEGGRAGHAAARPSGSPRPDALREAVPPVEVGLARSGPLGTE